MDGITVHTYGPMPQSWRTVREFLQTKREYFAALHAADCNIYHNTPASPLTGWTRLYTQVIRSPLVFMLAHENDHTRLTGKTGLFDDVSYIIMDFSVQIVGLYLRNICAKVLEKNSIWTQR